MSNFFQLDFMNHCITLTVCFKGTEISKSLSEIEVLTIMGLRSVVYTGDTSLFCLASSTFNEIDEEDLFIFLNYTEEEWDDMWEFIHETYYNCPQNVVDCRKN